MAGTAEAQVAEAVVEVLPAVSEALPEAEGHHRGDHMTSQTISSLWGP